MPDLFNKLKNGVKVAKGTFGPGRYAVAGINVTCPHCKQYEFKEGVAQLNTAGMSFLRLDWLNKSVSTLICTNCGHIQWFDNNPERL